jgi:ubiquinone/menaquinone biosynthesis C-methylase UbiE
MHRIETILELIEKYRVTGAILLAAAAAFYLFIEGVYFNSSDTGLIRGSIGGGVLVLSLVLFLLWYRQHSALQRVAQKIYSPEDRYSEEMRDLMIANTSPHGIEFGNTQFNNVLTINDLIKVAKRESNRNIAHEIVEHVIIGARRAANTRKYAKRWDKDEKLRLRKEYGLWTDYLKEYLATKQITSLSTSDVIDVGFGNGYAYEMCAYFLTPKSFRVIDVSEEALALAQLKFPESQKIQNDAEDLVDIPDSDVDIYFSFRTYQSSLLDQRKAIHEAFRVIRPRGVILLSIPCRYVVDDKEVYGLGDWKKRVTKRYLMEVVSRIKSYMEMLGFTDIDSHESPYEIFIYGRKPGNTTSKSSGRKRRR